MKASILKVLLSFGSLMVSAHSFSAEQSPASFDELSKSIQLKLNSSNNLERYHSHKANMWLAYAKNEQSENSLTDAGREAFENSQMLANTLIKEQVATLPLTTPILSVSQVMRRDLWQQIEYFKQHGALHSAPQALAEAEVMLVWAAAEYCELGWIHAKEHFYAVERRLNQVKQTLPKLESISFDTTKLPTLDELNGTGCQGVNSAYWPIVSNSNLSQQEENSANNHNLDKMSYHIENVVHFALDQAVLSTESKFVLNRVVDVLQHHQDITLTLLGYTDSRASETYNVNLSQQRIDTVKDYLVNAGVEYARIYELAMGEQDLIQDALATIAHAKSRRVVIDFQNIDGIQLSVQPQWRDLQLEMK